METQTGKKAEKQVLTMRARDVINELVACGTSELMIAEKVECSDTAVQKWRKNPTPPKFRFHRDNLARLYLEVTGKTVVVSATRN